MWVTNIYSKIFEGPVQVVQASAVQNHLLTVTAIFCIFSRLNDSVSKTLQVAQQPPQVLCLYDQMSLHLLLCPVFISVCLSSLITLYFNLKLSLLRLFQMSDLVPCVACWSADEKASQHIRQVLRIVLSRIISHHLFLRTQISTFKILIIRGIH